MAKTNPLFVDSTKMRGDRIGTQVELQNVILHDNERLFITVMSSQGQPMNTELEVLDEKSYGGRVLLKHLENISYQFVIEAGDTRVFQSVIKQAKAEHALVEKWEPVMEEAASLIDIQREEPVARPAGVPSMSRTWISDAARTAESLVEKWDL